MAESAAEVNRAAGEVEAAGEPVSKEAARTPGGPDTKAQVDVEE